MSEKALDCVRVPEHFFTTIRKVEPIGYDCVRIYHSIERDGAWQDVFTVLIPIASLLANAQFVTTAAREIVDERREQAPDRELVH